MQLPNTRGQQQRDITFDASGTIVSGSAPQLVLPEAKSRSFLAFYNNSKTADMYLEFGAARATAVLTSGVVTSVSITNGGFGYTLAPDVLFLGGGNDGWDMNNSTLITPGMPGWPAPASPAKGIAVVGGGAVTGITINNGGANYKNPPYVLMTNSYNDPFGCASPSVGVGFLLEAGTHIILNGTACTTDSLSVFCATASAPFSCKYMQ